MIFVPKAVSYGNVRKANGNMWESADEAGIQVLDRYASPDFTVDHSGHICYDLLFIDQYIAPDEPP